MPNCFSLTRKSAPEAGPVALQQVDIEMCKHFGVPVDAKTYHAYWYEVIGFPIACGTNFEQLRERFRSAVTGHCIERDFAEANIGMHYIAICDWLEANFTTDAWASRY